MGGVEEPVADVDVAVEVVEVIVVSVALVDVLHGGDGLDAEERRVAVGLHGQRAGSRVRVWFAGGGRGETLDETNCLSRRPRARPREGCYDCIRARGPRYARLANP